MTAATLATPRQFTETHTPTLDVQARTWLRLEGAAMLVAGAIGYWQLGGDWLWFLPALIAPDLSGLGYLRGPRVGAALYNLFHNWAIGLIVLGTGLAIGNPVVSLAGTILIAHTGMDRSVGYGLKLMSGFHDTHLGRKGGGKTGKRGQDVATPRLTVDAGQPR
jgi:Domain of unknown function (DUF4260)